MYLDFFLLQTLSITSLKTLLVHEKLAWNCFWWEKKGDRRNLLFPQPKTFSISPEITVWEAKPQPIHCSIVYLANKSTWNMIQYLIQQGIQEKPQAGKWLDTLSGSHTGQRKWQTSSFNLHWRKKIGLLLCYQIQIGFFCLAEDEHSGSLLCDQTKKECNNMSELTKNIESVCYNVHTLES